MFCPTSKSRTYPGKGEGAQLVHSSAVVALVVLLTIAAMLVVAPGSNAAGGCGDLQVVGLAGSGELGDKKTVGTDSLGLTNTDFYDKLVASYKGSLTQVTEHGVPYLDQSVPYFELHQSYGTSKQSGVDNALKYLNTFCTTTKLVLVGYSQGADVVMEVYSKLILNPAQKDRVVSVILFADPNFNPQSHPLDQGTYTQRPSGHGIWGARTVPPSPPDFQSIARSYCLLKDPICNSTLDWSTAYSCAIGDSTRISCLKALPELQHLFIGCRIGLGVDSLDCPHYAYRETGMTLQAALFVKKLFPPRSSLDHLAVSPNRSTVNPGGEQRYSAEGFDAAGASTGDITASTTFSIAPDGSCTGPVCTATSPGAHIVTGTNNGVTGTATLNVQPIPTGLTDVRSITIRGALTAFAVKTDGTVWAWGSNTNGVLGNGATVDSAVPVRVTGLTGVRDIVTDNFDSVHALKTDGTVWSWGSNTNGVLGNGTTANSAVPVQVTGLTGVQKITSDSSTWSVYALKTDGTTWAWGDNHNGQLGNGTTTNSAVPVQVTGLTGVQNIAVDLYSAVALKTDGTVWAWGINSRGELGNGTTTNSAVPVQVTGLTGVQSVTTHGSSAYALMPDGTVRAWGFNNWGQLGNDTNANSAVPVQVTGLTGVQNITTDFLSAHVVKTDGTVWSWGYNQNGQLGNGTTTTSHVPVQVTGLSGVQNVFADHAVFALMPGGTVWAWGLNSTGQLGIGTTTDSSVPLRVG